MGRGLLRGVDRDPPARPPDRRPGRRAGPGRAVALLAQVEQDDVPHRPAARPAEDRRDELGPLRVREVARGRRGSARSGAATGRDLRCISTSWLNSTPSRSTSASASAIAVRPAPGVGQVAERDRPAPAAGLRLDPEPERRPAVVAAARAARPAAPSASGTAGRRSAGPARPRRAPGTRSSRREPVAMPLVAVERDPPAGPCRAGWRRRRGRRGCGSGRPRRRGPSPSRRSPAARPARAGRCPGRSGGPRPPDRTRVAFPRDPLASTANWTAIVPVSILRVDRRRRTRVRSGPIDP